MLDTLAPLTNDATLPDPKLEGVEPRGAYIVIRPLELQEATKGGIILTSEFQDSFRQVMCLAKVLKIGPNAHDEEIQGPIALKPGDTVMFDKIAAERRVNVDGVELVWIHADKIIAAGNGLKELRINNFETKG